MFKNAYFGKAYKTRDGRKALFLCRKESNSNYYTLLIKSDFDFKRIFVNFEGKSVYEKYNDIVSEWQEKINEEELDELAKEYMTEEKRCIIKGAQDLSFYDLETAFKAGFCTRGCYCKTKKE